MRKGFAAKGRPVVGWESRPARRTGARRAARPQVGTLVPLAGYEDGGRAVLADGSVVAGHEVQPLNTLVLDEQRVEQLAAQVHKLLARIPAGQSLSLYVHSQPLDAQRLADQQQAASSRVGAHLERHGRAELGEAVRRLGHSRVDSLLEHVPRVPATRVRYFVFTPLRPPAAARPRPDRRARALRLTAAQLDSALDEHDRYLASVLAGLQAMRLHARPLAAVEISDLLWERCSPSRAAAGDDAPSARHGEPPPLSAARTVEQARAVNRIVKGTICQEPLDARARSHLRWARDVEQVVRLGSVPEETWLGWIQYLALAPLPFTLAVHFHGRDRLRERSRQKRRYKQLWASNRSQERMGKLVDPDREEAEDEAREVTATLKRQAAATVYDLSAYLAMREPGGDVERLGEELRATYRELTAATDAVVNDSPFAQVALWRATLPLGIDPPKRGRKYLSVNAADSWPLIGAGSGSPQGPTAIPLGYAQPGRELVWIDPFDTEHPNHVAIVSAQSGGGKTMLVSLLVGRAMADGARGAIIDRSGHWDFAAATIPGAATVRVDGGTGEHRVNPWDGEPTAEKVAFLIALHELLLTDADNTSSSLGKLEENLLGLAIRGVYRRCAISGETPRETLLQEELLRRHHLAREEGSAELASALRLLAESLHNYVGDGPYAWLCDEPTTVAVDAPLVVYDTRRLPESEAPAALFVICEAIIRQVEAERERFLAGDGDPSLPWAGKFFLVFEEVWKLVRRASTGRWVNELARRSRHLALWLIAISQQLDDYRGPEAEALISQSTLRFILRHSSGPLEALREPLGLSAAAIEQIAALETVKRGYSQTYLQNGSRGEGVVTIAVGPLEYWRSTSDPIGDEPLRRLALRHAGGEGWEAAWDALKLLADPDWHAQHDTAQREPS
ncbi:TraC family protein [Conexibacter stalactiti]|uniref:TraC family protein n=1 Tax=Conexibacter stalactiti TaxID=1940611 RepID=A0ABU4HRH6_9ACTN|nr:TraC family protein [Conexibacter stalactiti]MDW5595921.1 TraC family protein [Conexibacter stalactiti]MEC5036563.1 TraC family protein [Conexibacter stalactiti]